MNDDCRLIALRGIVAVALLPGLKQSLRDIRQSLTFAKGFFHLEFIEVQCNNYGMILTGCT
jgi:hypothetical protein